MAGRTHAGGAGPVALSPGQGGLCPAGLARPPRPAAGDGLPQAPAGPAPRRCDRAAAGPACPAGPASATARPIAGRLHPRHARRPRHRQPGAGARRQRGEPHLEHDAGGAPSARPCPAVRRAAPLPDLQRPPRRDRRARGQRRRLAAQRPRRLARLVRRRARRQPRRHRLQFPLPDPARGAGEASCLACAGPARPPHPPRLAGPLRHHALADGDLRRGQPPRHRLSRRQLGRGRPHRRAWSPGPRPHCPASGQARVPLSAGPAHSEAAVPKLRPAAPWLGASRVRRCQAGRPAAATPLVRPGRGVLRPPAGRDPRGLRLGRRRQGRLPLLRPRPGRHGRLA